MMEVVCSSIGAADHYTCAIAHKADIADSKINHTKNEKTNKD